MMNQGGNTQTMASLDPNLVEIIIFFLFLFHGFNLNGWIVLYKPVEILFMLLLNW